MKGIKGFNISMIDYPGQISLVIFLSNCNFRCGFCHNSELVYNKIKEDNDVNEVFDLLEKKKDWIDGVCITGGEPTLNLKLKWFIKKLKKLNMKVKLDTNGTNPKIIKELIEKKLIDYIAMDIKTSLKEYEDVVNVGVNINNIKESINIIMNSKIDYEFRTTIVPTLFNDKIANEIGLLLKDCKKYVLQQFRNEKTLDQRYQNDEPFLYDEVEKFANIMRRYIKNVEVRS